MNKNENGLVIKFPHGPSYLVRYENIPDKWINEEIDFTITYWKHDAPKKDRKTITRDQARQEVIEEIRSETYEELTVRNIVANFGFGLGWEEFEKEILDDKPFDLVEIWDDANYWEY